ncbi:MAG: DNA gyrase subunit A, partial [Pseudomonadota bacterium]
RLGKIADRLELVAGYIVAFLNLDRVIAIIRAEDEPKPVLIAEFALTDRQAEAILNMRLRSLRKLEEMELKREQATLEKEQAELQQLLGSDARQRTRLKRDLGKLRERYGPETKLGMRRTDIVEAAPARDIPLEAMIEREPVTVILSARGWVRAMRGHVELGAAQGQAIDPLKFKEGDGPAFAFHAQTTDKLLLAADNGRFYTLAADRLPGGRGFGEPVRAMIDLDGGTGIVAFLKPGKAERLLVAASDGRGFVVKVADTLAETRKGKTVVTPRTGAKLSVVRPIAASHDYVAAVGDNRKLLVFPLAELAELARGQGVQLQRFRDGGLSDAITFTFAEGLSWAMGGESGRTRTESDLGPWRAARGAAGRMPPTGFPRDNRF